MTRDARERKRLIAYLEDEVTRSEREAIEADLAESLSKRRSLDELSSLMGGLREEDPEIAEIDLVAGVRASIAAEERAPARPRRWQWPALSMGLAAAAAIVLALVLPRDAGDTPGPAGPLAAADDEFVAKSAGTPDDPDKWVGINIYRVDAGSRKHRVHERLHPGDELLFAYTNLSNDRPHEFLMILAIDGSGKVYWFHPAYEHVDQSPQSIRIRTRAATEPLLELVGHDFRPGPLVFYGIFSHQPLLVRDIETLIAGERRAGRWDAARPGRLPIADTGQQVLPVEVAVRRAPVARSVDAAPGGY